MLGRAKHHMIRIPDDTAQALNGARRVVVQLKGHSLSRALRPAPGSAGTCIWIGRAFLDEIGLAAEDCIEFTLQPEAP